MKRLVGGMIESAKRIFGKDTDPLLISIGKYKQLRIEASRKDDEDPFSKQRLKKAEFRYARIDSYLERVRNTLIGIETLLRFRLDELPKEEKIEEINRFKNNYVNSALQAIVAVLKGRNNTGSNEFVEYAEFNKKLAPILSQLSRYKSDIDRFFEGSGGATISQNITECEEFLFALRREFEMNSSKNSLANLTKKLKSHARTYVDRITSDEKSVLTGIQLGYGRAYVILTAYIEKNAEKMRNFLDENLEAELTLDVD